VLLGFYQDKTLISVSTSYEAIRLSTAAKYLGLDEQSAKQGDPNVIANFTKCGWTWDPETKLLHPKPIVVSPMDNSSSNGIRGAMKMLGTSGSLS
jgi:COP9 signalosome complex subunit 8